MILIATLILLFILIALAWGTAISGQLWFHKNYTDNFADGKVCIEHPTLALYFIQLLTGNPATLIPPIVTG